MNGFRRSAAVLAAILALSPLLHASLAFSPAAPKAGEAVTFVVSPSVSIVSSLGFTWSFGDGTTLTTTVNQPTVAHAYALAGTFTASVVYYNQPLVGGPPIAFTDRATVIVAPSLPKSIQFSPLGPNALETVTFRAINFTQTVIRWDFGDGTVVTAGAALQMHAYQNPGTYTARAYDGASDPNPASASVTVVNKRTLTATSFQPNTCETVTFQATGFVYPAARWDFGDGVVIPSAPLIQTHAFSQPGTYVVRASDGGPDMPSATVTVTVMNKRSVTAVPLPAKTGAPATFRASGFASACVQWTFGDGTAAQNGTPMASHVFKTPGTFLVTARDDCGNSACSATVSVPVSASFGPLAPFILSYGSLRWANGTTDILVPKDETGVMAYAEIKYEGTGLFQAVWRVDGVPVKTEAMSLVFAGRATLHSGLVPGLPTVVPGKHVVTLEVLQPGADFMIPAITYYVAAAARPTPAGWPAENLAAPLVRGIAPDTVERGKEYRLRVDGLRFSPSTVITLAGVGITGFRYESPETVWLDIFVPPTARDGARPAVALDDRGSNVGPGSLAVAKSSR